MATSDFWRKLANEFRMLNCSGLRLTWIYFPEIDDLQTGLFVDEGAQSNKTHFETLCVDAGLAIDPVSKSPVMRWLSELKKESLNDAPRSGRKETQDGFTHEYLSGEINNPCLAAATLCNRIQMREKRAEQDRLTNPVQPGIDARSASTELSALGLNVPEDVAENILGEMEVITGRKQQGIYNSNPRQPLLDAYRAIASEIVSAVTSNEMLDVTIPKIVDAYRIMYLWVPDIRTEECRGALNGAVTEWKGRRRKMRADTARPGNPIIAPSPATQRKQFIDAAMPDLDAEVEREAQKQVRIRKRVQELTPPEPMEPLDIVEEDDFLAPDLIPPGEPLKTPLAIPAAQKRKRLPGTFTNVFAAQRMQDYIDKKAMKQEEFASRAKTTTRTLLSFRKTGTVRKDIFDQIATAMGISRDDLLNSSGK